MYDFFVEISCQNCGSDYKLADIDESDVKFCSQCASDEIEVCAIDNE